MKCIAQTVHDKDLFWVKLHGGKVRSRYNYRQHIQEIQDKKKPKEQKAEKETLDRLTDRILKRQESIGRQRTDN